MVHALRVAQETKASWQRALGDDYCARPAQPTAASRRLLNGKPTPSEMLAHGRRGQEIVSDTPPELQVDAPQQMDAPQLQVNAQLRQTPSPSLVVRAVLLPWCACVCSHSQPCCVLLGGLAACQTALSLAAVATRA